MNYQTIQRRSTLLATIIVLAVVLTARGDGTSVIHHQGVVAVRGEKFTGQAAFRFALVDPATQQYLWTNDAAKVADPDPPTLAVTLAVVNGLYNVALGDAGIANMTAIPPGLFEAHRDLVLRIWFDDLLGDGVHVLIPDQPLTAAPYARQAANADTFAGPLGVGMIIPFFHPAMTGDPNADVNDFIPRNWVLCDGRTIDASHPRGYTQDEVDPAFWNQAVPDLRAHVARGAQVGQAVGTSGGSDDFELPNHQHAMDHTHDMAHDHTMDHTHDISHTHDMAHVHTMAHTHSIAHLHGVTGTTGSVALGGTDPGAHLYNVRDQNEGWTTAFHLDTNTGASTTEGQHRHTLGVTTGVATPAGSGGPSLPNTGNPSTATTAGANPAVSTAPSNAMTGPSQADTGAPSIADTADAGAQTIPTLPQYVAVHYIIRIK